MDAQWKRIAAIVGSGEAATFELQVAAFHEHLLRLLKLPCEVTGIEDFQWEERYVFGGGSRAEYERLKKKQPSYRDRYELVGIEKSVFSEWMLFDEDLGARVRRKSDGKEFLLGLSELKAVDGKSENGKLLHDFSVFLVNSR